MCFSHEGRFISVPVIETLGLPSPFKEIRNCGCQRALGMVPRVLLFPNLSLEFQPCLLHMSQVLRRPMGDECVEGLYMLEYHLISWVHVLVLVLVVHHISETSCVLPQVCGQSLS